LLVNEVGCQFAGTGQEAQPTAAFLQRPDFGAADQIAFGDDANEFASRVNDRQAAHVPLQHDICSFENCGLG